MNFRHGLSDDALSFHATKFTGFTDIGRRVELENENSRIALILDTETTGIDRQNDDIIEIALRQFCFDRISAKVLWIGDAYCELNDTEKEISAEVEKITGLTKDKLRGKSIDWEIVDRLLDSAALVIAHNAAFDRQFLDRYSKTSQKKIWACSFTQIDWSDFPVAKQTILALLHGFFYDSHRALNDIDALLHLLQFPSVSKKDQSFLSELLENARKQYCLIRALKAPKERKDKLKARGYFWNPTEYHWFKKVPKDQTKSERSFLENEIYYDIPFQATLTDIPLIDNFKF